MVKARALKNPITVEGFWLLSEEETETFIKVNPSLNNSENNPDNSRKKDDNSKKNDIKGKEKKGEYIYTAPPGTYFEDSSLNDAFLLFLKVRQNNGDSLTKEQVQLLREELLSMSDKPEELTAIVKKSAMNGWKSFYPLKKRMTRRAETDAIKEFVEYAKEQGSTHADHYYSNCTRLAYKTVGITDKETAAGSQLDDLSLVEHLIAHTLRTGMAAGRGYKDIYLDCKHRLESMKYLQCTA